MLPGMIVLTILFVGIVVVICRIWNKGQKDCQSGAEIQRARNGGRAVLEWSGPKAQGAAAPEFGELLVEIPKRSGDVGAQFYRLGLIVKDKRISYESLKDVVYIPGTPGLALVSAIHKKGASHQGGTHKTLLYSHKSFCCLQFIWMDTL